MNEEKKEFIYRDNPKTLSDVVVGMIRKALETVCPLLKLPFFAKKLDNLKSSRPIHSMAIMYEILCMM